MRTKMDALEVPANMGKSLERAAKEPKRAPIEDDGFFLLVRKAENSLRGPVALERKRKPAAQIKSKKLAQQRQEAEDAAATIMRHRIAANEKAHPQIFAQVRAPEFLAWYEAATGAPWDSKCEADIEEMRYRVIMATVAAENKSGELQKTC